MVTSDAANKTKYTTAELYNARKEVGGLLLEYLQFYAGSKLNFKLTEQQSRGSVYVEDRHGRELTPELKEAAAKINPFSIKGSYNQRLFNGQRVKVPEHMYIILKLKENILADEKFMASRNAVESAEPDLELEEHTPSAKIME